MSGTELFKLFGTIGLNGLDDVNKDLDGVTGKAHGASEKMGSAFKKIGAAIATYLTVDTVVNFGKACVDAAASVSAETAAFGQIMGDYATQAGDKMKAVADETGMIETRLTGYMTSLTAKFKGLGFDVSDATTLAADGLRLAADGAAFWDMSLDESVSHLNSFINGSYEGGEAIGLFANDTQMALYAVEQGLIADKKEWANLDEATKQATRLEYAQNMYKLSGATGQAAKESSSYLNVQGNLTEAWRQFQATAGEPILNNIVIPAMQKLTEILPMISAKIPVVVEWVTNMYNKFQQWVEYARGQFQPVVDSLKVLFENLKNAISQIVTAVTGFASSLTGGKNASDLMKTAIDALSGVLTGLVNAISGIVQHITQFVTWLNSGSAGAEALKAVIVGVTAAFVAWKTAMAIQSLIGNVVSGIKNMVTGFTSLWGVMMANPVTLIVAAIAGLVAAFVALWNNCEGFRNFWIGLWDGIKNIVSTAVDWIVNAFNKIIGFIKGNWQALLMMIVNPFAGAFKMLYDNCEGFRNFVNNFVTSVKNFFVNGWNAIKTATTTAWNNIKTAITNVLNNIKTGISNGISNAKTVISNGWNAVKTATSNAWNAIKTAITNVWNAIKTAVSNAINNTKTVISNGWNAVKTTTSNIWNGIKTTISNIWNGIKTTISNVINGVKSTISNAWNSVKTTTSNIWNGIKNTISNAIEAAKTKVSNVIEKIKGFFNFKITWPKIPMPHFSVSPAGWKIGDLLKGSIPKLGIEWYAKGAILDKPTAFGVNGSNLMVGGEAGKEAVAPIETLQAYVKDAVRSEFNLMESYMMRLVQTVDEYLPKVADGRNVVLDTGALVGAMGSHMDNTLGNINRRKERWG